MQMYKLHLFMVSQKYVGIIEWNTCGVYACVHRVGGILPPQPRKKYKGGGIFYRCSAMWYCFNPPWHFFFFRDHKIFAFTPLTKIMCTPLLWSRIHFYCSQAARNQILNTTKFGGHNLPVQNLFRIGSLPTNAY